MAAEIQFPDPGNLCSGCATPHYAIARLSSGRMERFIGLDPVYCCVATGRPGGLPLWGPLGQNGWQSLPILTIPNDKMEAKELNSFERISVSETTRQLLCVF